MLRERVIEFVFNVLSTFKVIWRQGKGKESHLTDWMGSGWAHALTLIAINTVK